ncbi:hypothetical protein [Microbacterium cremeum]|uniref:hypothetical protein n=1 Tax=Microbacterium cremeum TaxID=2782169 RepID=UPI001888834A|nr:hypothetical protein [Microbacterium cremeum]
MTELTAPPRLRIRWGWFTACIALGAAGILAGLAIAPPEDRSTYVAGVLGGASTTLLLVGIVVLLERRIIDAAVHVVRDAAEDARARSDALMREQVRELEDRLTAMWAMTATADDAARHRDETRRMTDDFARRVVDEYTDGADPA